MVDNLVVEIPRTVTVEACHNLRLSTAYVGAGRLPWWDVGESIPRALCRRHPTCSWGILKAVKATKSKGCDALGGGWGSIQRDLAATYVWRLFRCSRAWTGRQRERSGANGYSYGVRFRYTVAESSCIKLPQYKLHSLINLYIQYTTVTHIDAFYIVLNVYPIWSFHLRHSFLIDHLDSELTLGALWNKSLVLYHSLPRQNWLY